MRAIRTSMLNRPAFLALTSGSLPFAYGALATKPQDPLGAFVFACVAIAMLLGAIIACMQVTE